MFLLIISLLLSPIQGLPVHIQVDSLSPEAILTKADHTRSLYDSEEMKINVTIEVYEDKKLNNSKDFIVYAKGSNKTLIKEMAGNDVQLLILSLKNNFWVYYPHTHRPLRISPLQRLMGQVSNADISRISFTENYNPSILKTDTIEGKECYVLQLDLKDNAESSYPKIILWVSKDNYHPIKADFYLLSGKRLKTAYYEEYKKGVLYKTRIESALRTDQYSIIYYNNMEPATIPAIYFNKNYLKRLIR